MKVQKTKEGKLRMKVKRKEPIISHWSDPKPDTGNKQFRDNLLNSKDSMKEDEEWEHVSDHKLKRK